MSKHISTTFQQLVQNRFRPLDLRPSDPRPSPAGVVGAPCQAGGRARRLPPHLGVPRAEFLGTKSLPASSDIISNMISVIDDE